MPGPAGHPGTHQDPKPRHALAVGGAHAALPTSTMRDSSCSTASGSRLCAAALTCRFIRLYLCKARCCLCSTPFSCRSHRSCGHARLSTSPAARAQPCQEGAAGCRRSWQHGGRVLPAERRTRALVPPGVLIQPFPSLGRHPGNKGDRCAPTLPTAPRRRPAGLWGRRPRRTPATASLQCLQHAFQNLPH